MLTSLDTTLVVFKLPISNTKPQKILKATSLHMKSFTKLTHTDVKVGGRPDWKDIVLPEVTRTALSGHSVGILRNHSDSNRPLRTRCFHQQSVLKSSTWSGEEGRCKECVDVDRQCFYLNAQTIRIIGE